MLVSCTVPTLNRPDKHQALYEGFCADQWPDKELVVLDESKDASPFFTQLQDARVRYFHEPGKPREGGVTRIGAARNRLTELARGEIIQSRDDDDEYDPSFLTEAIRRLGDADLVKLVCWRLVHRRSDGSEDLYLWDQRIIGGPAYAIRGDIVEPTDMDDMTPEEATAFRDAWVLGFMWSAVFRRAVALEIPFPEEGTEDVPWMRALVAAGKKIVQVADAPHLATHLVEANPVHPEGGSPHFPQVKLRAAAAKRMMGAGISRMDELPQGQAIQIEPGKTYNILACLKASHTTSSIAVRAKHWGLNLLESRDNVDPSEFGVQPCPDGYRLTYFSGVGDKAVTLPWQAPKFAQAIGEKSKVVRAWIGAGRPADLDDAWMVRVFVGAGATPIERRVERMNERLHPPDVEFVPIDQPKPHPSGHVCSAGSSQTVARQLDPRWTYAGTISRADRDRLPLVRRIIASPAGGQKNVPTWTDGSVLVLQCPYSGELFRFTKTPAQLGAGQSPPPPPPTGIPLEDTLWGQAAKWQGNLVAQLGSSVMQSRPDPNADNGTILAWLNQYGLSPAFVYPEWPWQWDYHIDGNGYENAVAYFDKPDGSHVKWRAWANGPNVGWDYYDWSSPVGQIVNALESSLTILASLSGFVFAAGFVSLLQTVQNHGSIGDLGQALKRDWDQMSTSAQLAFTLASCVGTAGGGCDWSKAWDLATDYGKDLSGIVDAFAPGPAPDRFGNLTVTGKTPPAPPLPPAKPKKGVHPAVVATVAVAGTAVAVAGGVGVFALATGLAYGEAWRRAWDALAKQAGKSGGLLLGAGTR